MQQYDSLQHTLPENQRDGSVLRWLKQKNMQLNGKFRNQQGGVKAVIDKFLHSLPKMMFISMPLITAFITLLYRRHQSCRYVHVGILVIHNYVAVYVFTMLSTLFSWQAAKFLPEWFGLAALIVVVYSLYNQYKALRNFFAQSRWKTILKYLVLLFFGMVLMGLLSIIFVINSLLQV